MAGILFPTMAADDAPSSVLWAGYPGFQKPSRLFADLILADDLPGLFDRATELLRGAFSARRSVLFVSAQDGEMTFAAARDESRGAVLPEDLPIDYRQVEEDRSAAEDGRAECEGSGSFRARYPFLLPLRSEEGKPVTALFYADTGPADIGFAARRLGAATARLIGERLRREGSRDDRLVAIELREAAGVQAMFVPGEPPAVVGLDIDVEYQLARGLGGDFYDFLELDNDLLAIELGDVLGHSIKSALVMASCRTLLRGYCLSGGEPAEVLARANRALERELPDNMFVTAFLGFLNLRDFSLTYANAGQCLPLLVDGASRSTRKLEAGGLPLGFQRKTVYRQSSLKLGPGDALVLQTDGVTEAKIHSGGQLGQAGLQRILNRVMFGEPKRLARRIHLAVREEATGPGPLADDLTIITLRVARVTDAFSFQIPSTEEDLHRATARVEAFALSHGFVKDRILQFRLLLNETLMNAFEHGNKKEASRRIVVAMRVALDRMSIRITDEGSGLDPELVAPGPTDGLARGRGLALMRRYADSLRVSDKGNTVILGIKRGSF